MAGVIGWALYSDEQKKKIIQRDRGNADIDLVCSYLNIQKRDGVYQLKDFEKKIPELRRYCYLKDEEIEKLKIKFGQKKEQQEKEQHIKNNMEYEQLKRTYYNQTNQYSIEDYYEVTHSQWIPLNKIQERMDKIYQNTFWKDVALEPPYILSEGSLYIEVWHVKKARYMNMKKYYDIAVKKLKHDKFFGYKRENVGKVSKSGHEMRSEEIFEQRIKKRQEKFKSKQRKEKIKRCPECNNTLSIIVKKCPYCGYDFNNPKKISEQTSIVKWQYCTECGHRLNKVAKKCPYCNKILE